MQYTALPLVPYMQLCEANGWEPSLYGLLAFEQQIRQGIRPGDQEPVQISMLESNKKQKPPHNGRRKGLIVNNILKELLDLNLENEPITMEVTYDLLEEPVKNGQ